MNTTDNYTTEEENNYNAWVGQNLLYIHQHKTCINIMKKLYIDGFIAGVKYKQQKLAEEQLQK